MGFPAEMVHAYTLAGELKVDDERAPWLAMEAGSAHIWPEVWHAEDGAPHAQSHARAHAHASARARAHTHPRARTHTYAHVQMASSTRSTSSQSRPS